jgi:hypothetical protein
LKDVTIRVISVIGKEVYRSKFGNVSGEFHQDISLGNQAAGIFILQIISGNSVISRRVTIQK